MTNKYVHLDKEQRNTIEHLINNNNNFTSIAEDIKVDRTTISKEIRRNRYVKSSWFSEYSNTGIEKAINACERLRKPPYCCNACPNKGYCTKIHLYYNATKAQKHYDEQLVEARKGLDITKEEIDKINEVIVPLVKNKKQSVNQIYANHSDILTMSKTTFYKYVDLRVIGIDNLDLTKKVKYKQRKNNKDKKNKRNLALSIGRTYEDYIIRVEKEKTLNEWQLDTVIGKNSDSKALLTFLFVKTNFMIIRLLDKKCVDAVNKEFDKIKEKLGTKLYEKIVELILTDNGSEFFDPVHIESDMKTGKKLTSLYYCHPNSPEEKSEIECNHKYIRFYLPKSTSFEKLTKEQVKKIEDNINNIPRDIFGNKTPYELTKEMFPELIELLDAKYIEADEVTLNPDDIFGGTNEK